MSHDDADFDNTSIMSVRNISSVLSTMWSRIPSSSRKVPLVISDIFSYIDTTPDADQCLIKELVVRKEKHGFRHEFLLVLLAKPQGEEFWMRLERKGPSGVALLSSESELDANDIVSTVIDLY